MLVAGCSFRLNGAASRDDGPLPADAPTVRDAPAKHLDAAPDAAPDASTWPCGPMPTAPPTTVTLAPTGASLAMTAIDLSGQGQLAIVAPNTTASLSLHMRLTDMRCMQCIDQLEVGWVQNNTGNRSGCAFDNTVPNPGGVDQAITDFSITTPTTPGSYDLRTNIGQNFSCNAGGANNWWGGSVPVAATTIVKICVH